MTTMKLAIGTLLGLTITGCDAAPPPPSSTAAPVAAVAPAAPQQVERAAEPHRIRLVTDRNLVCMVNDQLMGVQQIPVEVGGRTYFGCCPGCKERLEKDLTVRTAVDPVSGLSVDKALATIGVKPDGRVVYFQNEANLRVYGH